MICGGKRRAYQRIPARDIVYSIVDEERGKDCGRVKTTFLKVINFFSYSLFEMVMQLPGKRNTGPSGWTIPAKVQVYVWLGMLKHKKNFVLGIPRGYEVSQELKNVERPKALPPSVIHYVEKHVIMILITVESLFFEIVADVPTSGPYLPGQVLDWQRRFRFVRSICSCHRRGVL